MPHAQAGAPCLLRERCGREPGVRWLDHDPAGGHHRRRGQRPRLGRDPDLADLHRRGGGGRGFFGGGGGGPRPASARASSSPPTATSLTNRHVVEGSQSLKATLADGSEYPASVVTTSDTQDLALVKVDATGLKPATIGNSDEIKVGQTAIAIGSPLGTFTETVTRGIVSALDRSIQVQDEQTGQPVTLSGLIQTDAAINPGNSGGPLLNAAGQVVGVNTATAATAEGIGFAIPIKEAQSLIDQARTASVA